MTSPTPTSSQPRPSPWWKTLGGPIIAFAGGAALGLVLIYWLSSGDPGSSESASPEVPSGQTIRTLDEQEKQAATDTPTPSKASPRPSLQGDYTPYTFETLAGFEILAQPGRGFTDTPEPNWILDQVPAEIRALDGQSVAIEGFMLPLRVDMEKRKVKELALMKDHAMCCFGEIPDYHEFILIEMKEGHELDIVMEAPVRIYGQLSVQEVGEGGQLYGIYSMKGEGMQRL